TTLFRSHELGSSFRFAPGHRELALARVYGRGDRQSHVLERLRLDSAEERPFPDRLSLVGRNFQHGSPELGAYRRLALRLQLARDHRPHHDTVTLDEDDIFGPDLH